MKRVSDVGRDFDRYAERWRRESYELEVGGGAEGVKKDPSSEILHPGDEWGSPGPLRVSYQLLTERHLPGRGRVNVLEIGAGGGRSTAVLLEVLGKRAGDYHVVDVSAGFVEVLKQRVDHPIEVHIVDDVDLSQVPRAHFDLCLAQSSWSHISVYDQFRYLRELRPKLKPEGLLFVNGQFLLGLGHDWTWNRFLNRVRKVDEGKVDEIFHEFTSVAALGEMLVRLGYDIVCINSAGFVARRGTASDDEALASLTGPIRFPFNASQNDFLETGRFTTVELPHAVAGGATTSKPVQATATGVARRTPKLRKLIARIPGARPLVQGLRRLRSGRH